MNGKLTITKTHEWDMGHRLGDGYKSKCKHLHGHRYKLEITLACNELNEYGMVHDFGAVKQMLGGWIDANLDHACLVSVRDKPLIAFLSEEQQRHFRVPFNTTVENLVVWLAQELQTVLDEKRREAFLALPKEQRSAILERAEALAVAEERCENYSTGMGPLDAKTLAAERKRNGRAITELNFVLRDVERALTITHLRLYETPNGFADWNLKETTCRSK